MPVVAGSANAALVTAQRRVVQWVPRWKIRANVKSNELSLIRKKYLEENARAYLSTSIKESRPHLAFGAGCDASKSDGDSVNLQQIGVLLCYSRECGRSGVW